MIDVIKNIGHFSFRLPDELSGLDGKNRAVMLDDVVSILEEYQRKQPKTDWIPCEVDQPKEYGQYLYTDKNDEVHEGCYCPQYHGMISGWSTCEATGFTHLSDYEVIAWQPLPQPYKKEGAE